MAIVTRSRIESGLAIAVVGGLALAASLHQGVPAAEVDLNDGGVWVTNASQRLVGHLNVQARTLDGGLRASNSTFDVSQFGGNVVLSSPDKLQPIDTAMVALLGEATAGGLESSHGGDLVLIADAEEGSVWATTTEGLASFTTAGEPLLTEIESPRVLVSATGLGFVIASDGSVKTVNTDGATFSVGDSKSLGHEVNSDTQFTAVGNKLVALDPASGRLFSQDGKAEIEVDDQTVLQLPSKSGKDVYLATAKALLKVPVKGGNVQTKEANGSGYPAAPVQLDDCAYGAWGGSGAYVRECDDEQQNVQETYPDLAKNKTLVFRVNRKFVVLNDVATGAVYLPEESMLRVDNWDVVKTQIEERKKKSTEETDEIDATQVLNDPDAQHPPEAVDDEFGVRAGNAATLPVLLNDIDIDGDVLTVKLNELPKDVTVAPARDGRAVAVNVPADKRGSFSFTYQAYDGKDLSNKATVKVTVRGQDTNGAPELRRRNTIHLAERATTQYAVLADWVDPDGDPFYLENGVGDAGLAVTYRPDGYVQVRDLGTAGPGNRTLSVTVSDGRDSMTEELRVQVSAGASNHPPVANNDHVVVNVGEVIKVRPLANDTDPDGDELSLSGVSDPPPDCEVKPDFVKGTFAFKASKPGSREIVYTVTDGPNASKGKVRIDVLDPKEAAEQPSAENDIGLLPANGSVVVDVLANDFDPAGGILAVQSVSVDPKSGLSVEVLNHARLRVSSTTGLEKPANFEYVISNGTKSASANVLVIPMPLRANLQPPVAADDETIVRAGDIVTLDVLANDYSPSDLTIHLVPKIESREGKALGEVFASDDVLRFKAGDKAGQASFIYTVADSEGNVASAKATITVQDFDDRNRQPVPRTATARVFSGSDVRIPIKLDGIDPDGDSVELVGVGDKKPLLGAVEVEGGYLWYKAGRESVGTDMFDYVVKDRFGATGQSSVRVGIIPAPGQNQSPVAVADNVTTRPNKKLEIPVTKNDVDPDGDEISIVADSVKPVDGKPITETKIVGQKIGLSAPAEAGIYQFYYDITDGGGAPVTGVLTLTVDPDAPLLPPVARDDYVAASATKGLTEVTVDVLVNDEDLDGRVEDLKISVPSPARVEDGKVIVPLADDRQVLLYEVTDVDELKTKAAIIVPGKNQIPPYLDPDKIPLEVKGGETAAIDLSELVITREAHQARLTSADKVVAGAGGNTKDPNLGLAIKSDTMIEFTPDALFIGSTSVNFEVTDGQTVEDPRGLLANLSVPITVTSSGLFPPTLRPSEIKVAPGENPIKVRLSEMVDDPDPGDNEKMTYSLVSTTNKVVADISGQEAAVSVPADVPVGSKGSIRVKVHDGTTDPQEMDIPVTVITSPRPLMNVGELSNREARVGEPTTFDLSQVITNPFADKGGDIVVVGQPKVTGPASASVSGLTLTVTPTDVASDMAVSYVVQDATRDPARQRTGIVRLTVKDVPEPPINVSAKATLSRTAEVSWTQGDKRGGSIKNFTVKWAGGNFDCGLKTTCTVTGLTNNKNYVFTVTQTTEVGESASSGASNQVWVDVKPDVPAAPTPKFGDRQMELNWPRTNVPDGGSPVTEYTLEVSPAVGGTTQRTVSGTNYVWTGLTNGTSYKFRLQASNKHDDPSEWGPWSVGETPAGAPSNIAAPRVTKNGSIATVQQTATVSWSPPANSNGDIGFRYELREMSSGQTWSSQSGSQTVSFNVSTQARTFQVRATNKSGLWSEWSPSSSPVRFFQPPGRVDYTSIRPTGTSGQAELIFASGSGSYALNGANKSETKLYYRVQGGSWRRVPGNRRLTGLPNGVNRTVYVRAQTEIPGYSAVPGEEVGHAVNTYGKPSPPPNSWRSASTYSARQVGLGWQVRGDVVNGRPIVAVRTLVSGPGTGNAATVRTSTGSVHHGTGPKQQFCIKVQRKNSEGQWSDYGPATCHSTRGNGRAFEKRGPQATCPAGFNAPCHQDVIRLQGWYPGKRVECVSTSVGPHPVTKKDSWVVDGNGNHGYDQFLNWVIEHGLTPPYGSSEYEISGDCRYA